MKLAPSGSLTVIAGVSNGNSRLWANSSNPSPSSTFMDGFGTDAKFNYPEGLAVDSRFNVYVADRYNNRIRMIQQDAQGRASVSTIAGNGSRGCSDGIGRQGACYILLAKIHRY